MITIKRLSTMQPMQPVLLGGFGLVILIGGLAAFDPLIAILCALVLLLAVVLIPRPIFIVYGLTFLLPLISGMARGIGIPFLRLGQALLVLSFIFFLFSKNGVQGKMRFTAVDFAFGLYFLTEAVFPMLALWYRGEHLDLNSSDNIYQQSALQALLGPLQYYLLYRIVVATVFTEKHIVAVLKLCFLSSIIVSIIGILQRLGIEPLKTFLATYYPSVTTYDIPDLYQRVTSTMDHYSGLGAYLSFIILAVLVCYPAWRRLNISPLLLVATVVFDSTTLVLTGTFAAWIGLAIGVFFVFYRIRKSSKTFIFILVGIGLAIVIFQPFLAARLDAEFGAAVTDGFVPQSFAFRIMLWQELFLPAVGNYLLFGAGPLPPAITNYPEESQYLNLLLRGGLPHFLSYFILIGIAIVICRRQMKGTGETVNRAIATATFVILVVLNVMNISGAYFTYIGGTQIIWTFLAIVVASEQQKVLQIGKHA